MQRNILMKHSWLKPNMSGGYVYLNMLLIGFVFMPGPTFTYSLTGGTSGLSWPWLQLLVWVVVMILLYPVSMRIGTRFSEKGFLFFTGPLMILPQALAVASFVGLYLYSPPEIHRDLERHLFLQGSTDLGGGCLFAGTVVLYVVFGFTASWYLQLSLLAENRKSSYGKTVLKALWILKFHIVAFVLGGMSNSWYDTLVTPNDFRNMFLFAGLVYLLSIFFISAIQCTQWNRSVKLVLAPLIVVCWLIVGSDGNTQRAGQLVQSGQDPEDVIRGYRHAVMVSWHKLCDHVLGDVE